MEVLATIARQKYLPWEPLLLLPIGDIQFDASGAADLKRLANQLAWGLDRGAYFIGMGDFVDFLSPSNRDRLAQAGLYDTASGVIDQAATRLEDELFELLKPTVGRWVGLLEGHHYFNHADGTTSDTRFAERLRAPYLGTCALVRISFRDRYKNSSAGSTSVLLWVHHGHGGSGSLPTAGLNKLYHQKVRYPGVRLFLMGHVPQLGHTVTDGLDVPARGEPYLIHEDTHYVLTGGFSRSYQQGSQLAGRAQGNYAEKAMMPPAVLGGAVITLTPEKHSTHNTSYRTVDIKVSS